MNEQYLAQIAQELSNINGNLNQIAYELRQIKNK